MPDAFYVPEVDRFVPTDFTRGPWSADAQHAGPPAALIARAIESLDPPELLLARFTLDLLRPVPLSPLRVEARPIRSGRSTQYVRASLSDQDGPIATAHAWRIRGGPRPEVDLDTAPPPGPAHADEVPPYDPGWSPSYFHAVEWRTVGAGALQPGPATVWMRLRYPLVEGEEATPATRVLVAADSGNGISWVLPFGSTLFANTDLTVHLARMPEGEWVCLDARTRIGAQGVGLTESLLWDERGMLGRAAQSLLVAERRRARTQGG